MGWDLEGEFGGFDLGGGEMAYEEKRKVLRSGFLGLSVMHIANKCIIRCISPKVLERKEQKKRSGPRKTRTFNLPVVAKLSQCPPRRV